MFRVRMVINSQRVLVVDNNVTCLHVLEKMLQDCSYQVNKCEWEEDALSMIRENKGEFDIVLRDVHMPGLDGLQLLAGIANMGITLPVVMFSSDAEKDTVLKGVNNGACDFLVKPIQINTLKILWRHVLRSNRSSSNNSSKEVETPNTLTTCLSTDTHIQAENVEENSKSLKRNSEDEADLGQSKSWAKKPHVVWTPELNQMFIMASNSLGNDDAKPKKMLQIMRKMTGVPYLTGQNVSSNLQKYHTNLKKIVEASKRRSANSSLINDPGFANLTHFTPPSLSLIGCCGIQNCAASARYPSQATIIAPRQQCTGCSMRMRNLVEFPDNNALPSNQMELQSQPLELLQKANPLLHKYCRQQQVNESAQCPSYAPVPSIGFTSPTNKNTHPILPNQSNNSLIMHMCQTLSKMQILDEAAPARHYLSATAHPHPLHSLISTHDIQSLNASTPHPASEQGRPAALRSIRAKANESCSSNIIAVKGEFFRKNHNPVAEDYKKAMFASILDKFS